MALRLTEDTDAVLLPVRVKPRAPTARIAGERNMRLLIEVTAPPVDSRANQATCRLLAKTLGIANGLVTIAAGDHARDKLVRIEGLGATQVAARLGLDE